MNFVFFFVVKGVVILVNIFIVRVVVDISLVIFMLFFVVVFC